MPHAGNRSDDDILVFGPFKLFTAKRELKHGDTPIAIGSRAIDLLIALVARAGQVVSHRDLMAQVWPGVTVEEANLRVHIAALRRALGDTGTNSRYISNVTGRGYTFVAPVERFYTERAPSQADAVPAAVHSNALPARVVQPVGRDETVRTLLAQLTMWRFISIVGPGGVGKTTVALTVAQASVQGFSGAVFFVDFSSVTDPRLVPGAVASSLGCTLHSHDPFPSLLGWLKDKRALLVLDNCESVVRAAAELAQRVIGAAPQVHILVTSREALRAEGEHVHILSSLDCPPEKPDLTAEEALRYPATQLFMDRAAAAGHRAKLADADAAVVARICRRLDGIALAIELAASRVGTHGIRGTGGLLDNRFGLAWKGRQSLLSAMSTGGATYYRLLDITRSYASTKLEERGETDIVCRKHAMSFCRLLEHDATLQSEGEHDLSAYKALVGNIRAALGWALSDRGEPAIGVKLAVSAVPLLIGLSLLSECGECCARALALLPEEDRGSRAEMVLQEALSYSSMFTKGNSDEVRAALDRGLALAEKFKDANRQLHFLSGLNAFLYRTGDFRSALAVAGRAKVVAELANESAGMVTAEWMLGIAHHCVGDQAEAERHCHAGMIRAVELAVFNPRFFRYDHRIRALVGLAGALWLRGYPRRALRTAQEAIDEAAVRNRPVSVCMSLYTAQAFFRAGELERARELAERLIEYAAQFALDPFRAVGIGLKAEFEIASGDVHAGVGRLREAIRLLQSEQHNVLYTIFCGALSEGLQNIGEYDEALIVANRAIDEAITSGAALELAELLRLKANVLATGTPANRAAALDVLDQSLRVAREQSALAYELRSATTLARLLSKEGQRLRAKQVLSPIYGRFTEGFDTPDLVSANVVLKGLE